MTAKAQGSDTREQQRGECRPLERRRSHARAGDAPRAKPRALELAAADDAQHLTDRLRGEQSVDQVWRERPARGGHAQRESFDGQALHEPAAPAPERCEGLEERTSRRFEQLVRELEGDAQRTGETDALRRRRDLGQVHSREVADEPVDVDEALELGEAAAEQVQRAVQELRLRCRDAKAEPGSRLDRAQVLVAQGAALAGPRQAPVQLEPWAARALEDQMEVMLAVDLLGSAGDDGPVAGFLEDGPRLVELFLGQEEVQVAERTLDGVLVSGPSEPDALEDDRVESPLVELMGQPGSLEKKETVVTGFELEFFGDRPKRIVREWKVAREQTAGDQAEDPDPSRVLEQVVPLGWRQILRDGPIRADRANQPACVGLIQSAPASLHRPILQARQNNQETRAA